MIDRAAADREHAGAPLDASEAHLLDALKIARAGHWQYDVQTDTFTFSDQFYAILRTTAEAVGRYTMGSAEYVRRFVHPDDAPLVRKAIQAAALPSDSQYVGELEHRTVFGDGNTGYIVVRWFPVRDARGRIISTHGVNQDITEQRNAERMLREGEAQFRSLVEQQVAGIIIMWENGSLAYVNPRFANMLGYEPSDVIGRSIFDFVAEPYKKMVADRTRERLVGQQGVKPTAFAIHRRDGMLVDVLGQTTLATWQERPALIGVVIDDSERKHAERALRQTIEALASMVELRDPYTAGHQRRVSKLAGAIARDIGMPESQVEGLVLASAVHDVGKIQVPTDILSKPGELTDLEFQLMQRHVQAGYDILKGVEFPWPVAQTVLQHHERVDGSGYPHGLKADAILLEAKILAVADVVDSIMSRRPYREGLGLEAALDEIGRGRGKLYDPAVVEACTSLFRQKAFSF